MELSRRNQAKEIAFYNFNFMTMVSPQKPITQMSRIFGHSLPTKAVDPIEEVQLQLKHQENDSPKQRSNFTQEGSKGLTLKRQITSMALMGSPQPSPILKTPASLQNLSGGSRKVNIDLQMNQQVIVENWKEVNRNNTFKLEQIPLQKTCCCLM